MTKLREDDEVRGRDRKSEQLKTGTHELVPL